jgi:hypothetical protein
MESEIMLPDEPLPYGEPRARRLAS